jgi:peptide/nickel transport system substrate-binding protein
MKREETGKGKQERPMNYWSKVLNERVSRRRTLAVMGGTAAGAAFLVACGGDDDDSSSSSTTEPGSSATQAGQASNQPKAGGNLRVGWDSEQHNLDPHVGGNNRFTIHQLLDPLTDFDDKVQPHGRLAESWEQSGDGLTLTLKLRQGVTWHSGREFTSEDVRWNLERVKDPNVPFAAFAAMSNWFTSIDTSDKYTVTLKSDAPRPSVWDFFNTFKMGDMETAAAAETVVGTGPFKFVEWRQGSSMKWERYPDYWRKDVPYLDEVNWQLNADKEGLLAQLDSDGLDLVLNPTTVGYIRFQGDSKFEAVPHPYPSQNFTIGNNVTDKPFDDKRVRQAMNWAMDRKRLEEVVMQNTVKARSMPWNSNSPAFDAELDQHYNLDLKKASDLLSAAGASNLSTGIITPPSFGPSDFLEIWQNDLKSIGVNLEIQPVESAAFPPLVNSVPLQYHSQWAASTGQSGGVPISLFVVQSTSWGGDGINNTGFKDEAYQSLIDQAAVELDPEKEASLIQQLNQMIIDSSHLMVIAPRINTVVYNSKVTGVVPNSDTGFDFSDISFV